MYMKKHTLQPPLSGQPIEVDTFLKECSSLGLQITKEDLEEYERIGLVYPVLRVFPKIIQQERIEDKNEQTYRLRAFAPYERKKTKEFTYALGSYSIEITDNDKIYLPVGDFDKYEIPALKTFRKWQRFKSKTSSEYSMDKRGFGTPADTYYLKEQALLLLVLSKELCQIHLPLQAIVKNKPSSLKSLLVLRREKISRQKTFVKDFYTACHLYYLAEIALYRVAEYTKEQIESGNTLSDIRHGKSHQERIKDFWMTQLNFATEYLKTSLSETITKLVEAAEKIADIGFQNDPLIAIRKSSSFYPQITENDSKNDVRFAILCYRISNTLFSFATMCGDREYTLQDYLEKFSLAFCELCSICQKPYKPNLKRRGGNGQIICDSVQCRKKLRLKNQQKRRKEKKRALKPL